MSSNNYVTPYYFTQPPPNYNFNNWTYNWQQHQIKNAKAIQDSRGPTAPPLPPGPPPPLPPPPSNSRTPSSHPTANTTNLEQRSQSYYNNITSSTPYRARRFNSTSTGEYSITSQYVSGQHPSTLGQYPPTAVQYSSTQAQYSSTQGQYSSTQGQYNSTSGQYNSPALRIPYNSNNSSNYTRNFYNKRKADTESENLKKGNKKKKKPLSQNVPQRKDWSVLDAKRALMIEKEYNKRHKSQSLIIKFPDLELNRDIVSKFNTAIESVHFQQPSTARFCFVTLKEVADPETVIRELNKVPFGHGFLTAEYKKDREDEINIGPEDIDPLTLYVGNLAQEVTKDDMDNTYPKRKRVDIGYAKKMKYTRYAFVSFKSVDDSVEAFKKTHSTQMYSKSLIVRFRRLNGPVGMPGEAKQQMPQRDRTGENLNGSLNSNSNHNNSDHNNIDSSIDHNDIDSHNHRSNEETESRIKSNQSPWEMVDISQWETDTDKSVDLSSVKREPMDDSDDEEEEYMSHRSIKNTSPFMEGDFDLAFSMHKPKFIPEIKKEKDCEKYSVPYSVEDGNSGLIVTEKAETSSPSDNDSASVKQTTVSDSDSYGECSIIPPEQIKKENDTVKTFSDNTYKALRLQHPTPLSKDSVPTMIKREPSPVPEEICREQSIQTDSIPCVRREPPVENVAVETLSVKSEPTGKDEENDGDKDDSSDDSDDFNFDKILSNLDARSKRLKKLKKSIA